MDPFIRQSSLEILLENHQSIQPAELAEALQLGLTDPDLNIAETAWNFVNRHGLIAQYIPQLESLVRALKTDRADYSLNLAKIIQTKLAAKKNAV